MGTNRGDQKSPEEIALAAHGITFPHQELYFSPDQRWLAVVRVDSEIFGETTYLDIFHVSRKFDKVQSHSEIPLVDSEIKCKLLWLPDSSGMVALASESKNKPLYIDLKTKDLKQLDEQRFNINANFSPEAKLQMLIPGTVSKIEYDFPQIAAIREKIKEAHEGKIDKEFEKFSIISDLTKIIMEYSKEDTMLELIKQFCEAKKFHASSRLPEAIRDQMEGYQDEYEHRIFLEKDEKSPDKDARVKKAAIEYLSAYLTEHHEKTPAECVAETIKQHPNAITFGSKNMKILFESISKINEPKQVNASAGFGLFAPAAADVKADIKAENPPFIDFLQKWIEQNKSATEKKQLVTEVAGMLATAREYQRKSILEANVGKFASVLQQKGVEGLEKFLPQRNVLKGKKG